jgi:hypothetical protein
MSSSTVLVFGATSEGGLELCRRSLDALAKPSGPKTRQRGFKPVLRRPIETAANSGHSLKILMINHSFDASRS